jgi:RNA polymerase sigma factor (sigma-70 family)
MRTPPGPEPDLALVTAARDGDRAAVGTLAAAYLPLVYNVVGRAMNGHPDVDDVVQETMLRAVRGLSELRDPAAFRSWLVAIAVRQVRDSYRDRLARPPAAESPVVESAVPEPDFAEATIDRLGLSGQRRQTAEATRWLDDDDQPVLALWWQEAAGELTRADLSAGLGLAPPHAAVRVARMKERLGTSRTVVHALRRQPQCAGLSAITAGWDGQPSPLWRKRLARHVRDCRWCGGAAAELIPAERLLGGLPLIAVPAGLASTVLARIGLAKTGLAKTGLAHLGSRLLPSRGRPGRPSLRSARHTRHGRLLLHGAVSVPPKLVAVAVAVTTVAAGGTFAVAHAHRAAPAAAISGPTAAASALAASPVPLVTHAAHLKPPAARRPSHSPSPSATASTSPPASTAPASTAPAAPAVTSERKGVSVWNFTGEQQALADSGASWYYNWGATPGDVSAPASVSYVPMIWGAANVTSATLAQVKTEGSTLLGFNEPDQGGQANMTVTQALDLWPQLEATGMTLGSPAVSAGADKPGGWLDQFMAGAKARGYRVDFITLHWYGGDFVTADAVQQLQSYVAAVYARYHLPVWVTEFALINFGTSPASYPTQAGQAAFLTAATRMLDGLSYVQRYAWFALPTSAGSGTTGLFGPGPSVTPVGQAFEAARLPVQPGYLSSAA